MKAFGRAALEWLAGLWILFGGLGLVMTATTLADPLSASPGWQWTVGVSVALILGGIAVLRRYRGARWIAAAAVAGGLAETAAWLLWMWTPVLLATAVFHAYGLMVLTRTDFRPSGRMPTGSRAANTEADGRANRRRRLSDWWY